MRASLVVLVAACGSHPAPAPVPAPVVASASASALDAGLATDGPSAPPPSACPDQADCSAPCVSIDGRRVELPQAIAVHKVVDPEDGNPPWDAYTIYYFEHGEAACARRDYDAFVSFSTGPVRLGTISWGGMYTVSQGVQLLQADGGLGRSGVALCVDHAVLHMDRAPTIVVQGLFAAALCP